MARKRRSGKKRKTQNDGQNGLGQLQGSAFLKKQNNSKIKNFLLRVLKTTPLTLLKLLKRYQTFIGESACDVGLS